MSRRVVVTGVGVISPLGAGAREFEHALYSGANAFGESELLGKGVLTGELHGFQAQRWLGDKGIRGLDRAARLLCVATHLALSDAGLCPQQSEGDPEIGLICGTMLGSVHSITSFDWSGVVDGPQYVSPMDFPNTVINSPAGQAAIRFKLRGVNSTLCAGLTSSLYALGYAADFIRLGRARALAAGGAEELSEESFTGLRKSASVSESGKVLPFAANRDGTIPGEGSALLVLELETSALERGVRPRVEIAGFGASHDAQSIDGYDLRGHGAKRAIEHALARARVKPEEVSCIVAGASGSRAGDEVEERALRGVFDQSLEGIPICAPKAAIGEVLGASGAMCALVAAMALANQSVPPTSGFSTQDVGLRLSPEPQPFTGDYALVNACGCDGNNTALVLRRLPD